MVAELAWKQDFSPFHHDCGQTKRNFESITSINIEEDIKREKISHHRGLYVIRGRFGSTFNTEATKSICKTATHKMCVEMCVCICYCLPFSSFSAPRTSISLLILGNLKVEFEVCNAKNQGTYYQPSL